MSAAPKAGGNRQITAAQAAMLRKIAAGLDPTEGLVGRSALGGASKTRWSLLCRDMLDLKHGKEVLTDLGRQAIEQHEASLTALRHADTGGLMP